MPSESVKFKLTGMQEFKDLLTEIREDFGVKDAKKILITAVKDAMTPVLLTAKSLAAVDTGALRESLRIEARSPNRRDKNSRYVLETDTIIGTVTTAPGNVLAKRSFYNYSASYKARKNIKTKGIPSDARANVQEHGSYKMAAHPFLRPALESQGANAASSLGNKLGKRLEQYKAKQARKA